MVEQETAKVIMDILELSKLKWTGMGEFNSDDHYIYQCWQESLRRNGVAIMVNKIVRNAVLGCNLKNDRVISVHFPRQTNQYHSKSKAMLQQVTPKKVKLNNCMKTYKIFSVRTNTQKRCPVHYRGLECKSRKSRNNWSNMQIWAWTAE